MRFLPAYAVFEHFPAKSGRGSVPKLQKTGGIRAACIDTDPARAKIRAHLLHLRIVQGQICKSCGKFFLCNCLSMCGSLFFEVLHPLQKQELLLAVIILGHILSPSSCSLLYTLFICRPDDG